VKRPRLLIIVEYAAATVLLLSLGTWLLRFVDAQLVVAGIWLILGLLARRRFKVIGWALLLMAFLGFKVELERHWPVSYADSTATSTPATPSAQPTNMLEIPARG
jgi:hypothetical protein